MDIGGRQAKVNEKSQYFKGWETLVIEYIYFIVTSSGQSTHDSVVKLCRVCPCYQSLMNFQRHKVGQGAHKK